MTVRECGPPARAARAPGAELERLAAEIRACRICRDAPIARRLPHEPRPVLRVSATARLLIASQAPGVRVHASGLPFDDRSGDRLREWMAIDRATFYDASVIAIAPMGFCFPGHDAWKGDLPPRKECRQAWHDRLFEALPQIETVLAIGSYAQAYHLARLGRGPARGASMTQVVRDWRRAFEGAPKLLPLPHPSWRNTGWLRANPWFERELLPALRHETARFLAR